LAVASRPIGGRRRAPTIRGVLVFTFLAALVVFAIVQDRVTANGTDQYVRAQRAAAAGQGPVPTIDAVMRPAVARSVQAGLLSGGLVAGAGMAAAALLARRSARG
jgi:hypothetical protein